MLFFLDRVTSTCSCISWKVLSSEHNLAPEISVKICLSISLLQNLRDSFLALFLVLAKSVTFANLYSEKCV